MTENWSEVGVGQRPPPNGAYFPPARARGEGGRPGNLIALDLLDLLDPLDIMDPLDLTDLRDGGEGVLPLERSRTFFGPRYDKNPVYGHDED